MRCRFEVKMENFEFDVGGAPVVYSNKKAPPHNPLNRPTIKYKKFIISISVYLGILVFSIIISRVFLCRVIGEYVSLSENLITFLFVLLISIIYILLILKRALIWLVHVYQHYAPDRIRLKCVFEPSCSEYMILCIKKYGAIRGFIKGCIRLLRCHPPNGGKDYP